MIRRQFLANFGGVTTAAYLPPVPLHRNFDMGRVRAIPEHRERTLGSRSVPGRMVQSAQWQGDPIAKAEGPK